MKNPFEEYGFEPFSESFDEETNRDTVYYISVNGFTYYIDLADINGRTWYWNITDSSFNPLYHDELGRAENLIAVECGDYLSEYFPLVYGFSLEDREEFMKADLARFVAKESLSSDEWESLAYPLFENNYIDKHKPSEKSILGHLGEPEVFEIARRFHNGEDIRKELALGLLDYNGDTEIVFGDDGITSSTYKYDRDTPRYKLHMEKAEDGVKLSLFDRERIVSYEEVGQTFIDMIHDEFDDLAFWWVRDDMKVAVPDISDETIRNILTAFDGAAIHGWENDQIKMNRIKKAIYDELGNEDLTEKVFACISKNKYNVSFENNNTENEGIINAAEIKKQQIIDEVFTDCKERLKYIGVETEPVRSEFAKAAEVPVDEITELLENERFVFLANDYLNGIEQISGMDAADIKAAEELLLQTTGTDMPGLRFDLYETARELFSKELEKNMEHGDQDIVFTKFHFEGDMVKLYPGRYSDVTDVPDWENVRKSLLRPENGVDDNVKVRCEQFVISCGDEREKRNERDAVSSELLILEAYFKNDPRTYELPKYLEDRLKRTYDDSEFVMMYLDPDDVVYDLLLNGEKKHTDTPEMSNSAFKGIYIMSNPRFALEQIKLNSCEWKKWDEAIMYMTDNKLSADSIDMVAVKCYDNDGRPGVKDLTPEGLYVLNQHTIKSSIAAGIARQKYEELLKSAETVSASEDSQSDSRKKNVGRK
ncbi:hypothetical protein SAMN02910447_03325 [Ruminococcus sp. YE71]|nr:hypothetical protein SAMN02910446_03394 [Ruminococcus sp. YE78]SFW50968.1 hypothetical protein SAMN02910447_03325 [Ruminococcus sp. YE71]